MEYSRVTRQQRGELRGCPAGSIRPADIEEPRQRAVHEHCRRLGDRQHRTAIGSGGNSHLYARILHLLTQREACPREPDDCCRQERELGNRARQLAERALIRKRRGVDHNRPHKILRVTPSVRGQASESARAYACVFPSLIAVYQLLPR